MFDWIALNYQYNYIRKRRFYNTCFWQLLSLVLLQFWEDVVSFTISGRNQGFRHNFSSYAEWEKTYGYQLSSGSESECDDSDSDSDEKKNGKHKIK